MNNNAGKWKRRFTIKLIIAISIAALLFFLKDSGSNIYDGTLEYIKTDRYYQPVYQFFFSDEYPEFENAAIVTPYGSISLPGNREYLHRGVDYDFLKPAEIKSLTAGTVVQTGKSEDYGKFVTVSLGSGYMLTYGNLDKVSVRGQDQVAAGQVLAQTKRFLHLEMEKDGEIVKPLRKYTEDPTGTAGQ
jgi:murein DD-endopeptidase MepM/ murein hydrolase activator NlpD